MDSNDDRAFVAKWLGMAIAIMLLESHILRRPIAFLLAPFVTSLFFLTMRVSAARKKGFWALTIACSIGGFLLG